MDGGGAPGRGDRPADRGGDARTHQALRTGAVPLPRRSVHAGVWLRLLRTLLDELSTPLSALRIGSQRTMKRIWEMTGQPPRAGITGPWRPYEGLLLPQQQMFLEAAATALHLIEAGEATAHGTLAPLLTPAPRRHVPDGTPPLPRERDYWQEARDVMDRAVALARDDPAAAHQLLSTLTALTRSETAFHLSAMTW